MVRPGPDARLHGWWCCVLLALAMGGLGHPTAASAQELVPTYYQGFDTGKIDGPVGKAGNALSLSAHGLLSLDRGTLAFFVQSAKDPTISEWDHIGPAVSPDRDGGYWGMGMSFSTRREDFLFNLFDVGGYAQPLRLPTIFDRWKAGQWHHLAAVWDRQQGIVVYEDGKQVGSTWGQQRWAWSSLAQSISTRDPVDEVYLFDVALTAEQVAQLAAGQKPTGTPMPLLSGDAADAEQRARMGWFGDSLAQMPRASAGVPLALHFAVIKGATDANRPVAYPIQGLIRTTWPSHKYGPSVRGRRLQIDLDPGQSFDRVRIMAHRGFVGSLHRSVDDDASLADFRVADAGFWHVAMPQAVTLDQLILRRRGGSLGQIDFYRTQTLPADKTPGQGVAYQLAKLEAFADDGLGLLFKSETAPHLRRPVLAQRGAAAAWTLEAPAFGGFQAATEAPTERQAYDGAVVQLVAEDLRQPTPVRVTLREPVDPERIWLAADVVLEPKGNGPQTFTLVLRGRPVAGTPAYAKRKYLKDGKYSDTETIDVPAMPFGITVEAGAAMRWKMGAAGTAVTLLPAADQKAAIARAADHQVEWMREAYAERMEGHDYANARLILPLVWLAHHAPQRMEFRQMWERVETSKPNIVGVDIPKLEMPEIRNDSGAPDWAFWQMQVVNRVRRHLHWMIDHKQVWTGEFGGVWNDDADHVENWMGYMLCLDGSGKIKRAMRRYWDGVWRYHLVDGVGTYTQDAGHYAEEGTMNLGMRLLVEYGDPVAYARSMLASRRYKGWIEPDPAGGYRWKSFWVGPNGAWTQREFYNPRKAGGHQSDVIISMGYLTWYNRHPVAGDVLIGLEEKGFGFLGTARQVAKDWDAARPELEKILLQPLKTRIPLEMFVALNELGLSDEARKLHTVEYKPVPPIAHYWGSHDTDVAWFRWKVSGDDRYLVDAYRRTMEWFYSHDWLNGQAQPSLDRNPLPRGAMIRSRIGTLAANRGGSGLIWPQHAISFTRGGDDVASLVTVNLPNQFAVKLYPFTSQPLDLQLRVWRCHGTFQVTLHRDANDDGVGDEVIWQKEMTLDRGAFLDLQLPVKAVSLLTVTPIKVEPVDYEKADPAISVNSIEFPYGGHLIVHVYNNGRKPVDDVLVRVRDGRSGQIVVSGEQRTGPIEAPLDLQPRYVTVEFKNIDATVWGDLIVEIDPDRKVDDLTRYNNSARVTHDGTFDLNDWWMPGEVDGEGRTRPAFGQGRDDVERLAD